MSRKLTIMRAQDKRKSGALRPIQLGLFPRGIRVKLRTSLQGWIILRPQRGQR